jgi:large conductance mechanosensitive channel
MLKGFREFILRGNVVDLAVAVVIGAAFATIITAFTDKIIQPLINAITPSDSPGLGVAIVAGKPSTYVDFAALITAAINFAIVAAIIYFVFVLPINTIQERRRRGQDPEPSEPSEVELLAEIRDLLRTQQRS